MKSIPFFQKAIKISNKEIKMYWCAACGNPRVIIEKEKEGYSLAKGLVGSAVLGPVGAVAGTDGKEVTVFYCPKCGARLHNSMPEYEVSNILKLLKDAKTSAFAKSSLEKLKEKYPNMLWSEELDRILGERSNQIKREDNTSSSESDNSLYAPQNAIDNSIVFSGDVEKDIKDYLNRINAPVRYSEIKDSFQKSTYSEIVFINGILGLIENGLIKCSGDYFALVRDLDEMVQLKECGSANRKKLEGELFYFKKDLEENERIAEQKEENEIIEALGYMYKLKLLSYKTKARRIKSLLEKNEEELKKIKSNKEEAIKRIEQSIIDLQSSPTINCEEAINSTTAAVKEKESELSSLSFWQFGRKRTLNEEVEALNDQRRRLQMEKAKAESDMQNLQREREDIINKAASAEKSIADSCSSEKEIIKKWDYSIKALEEKIDDINNGKINEKDYLEAEHEVKVSRRLSKDTISSDSINSTIEKMISQEENYVTAELLQGKYQELKDVSSQRINSVLSLLESKGYVEKKAMHGKIWYKSIKPSNFFNGNNEQSRIATRFEMKYKLLQILNDAKEPVPIRFLTEKAKFPGVNTQRYGAMLAQMEKEEIIIISWNDHQRFYCI